MNVEQCLQTMRANTARIQTLAHGISEKQARWRPDAVAWSILEVINHLYDEEQYDFRVRLDIMLHDPERPWPKIDPQGWVQTRDYNSQPLEESLQNFLRERASSLDWLRRLDAPNWEAASTAPWGQMRAGDMLAAWVAHDLLHLRQLVELHHAYTIAQLAPYETRYAGEW
jgi:hypothetical protein